MTGARLKSHHSLFFIQIVVPPVVKVVASSSQIILGGSTTLFCNVTRTNPEVADILWTNENSILETSDIKLNMLLLSLSVVTDFGTYSCTVTNSAGEVGTGNVTITQGCKFTTQTMFVNCKSLNQVVTRFCCGIKLCLPTSL
jgi:hypothetical protein